MGRPHPSRRPQIEHIEDTVNNNWNTLTISQKKEAIAQLENRKKSLLNTIEANKKDDRNVAIIFYVIATVVALIFVAAICYGIITNF